MHSQNSKLDEWKENFVNWQSSGLTVKEWCSKHNTAYNVFYYWRKKLKNTDLLPLEQNSTFLELIDNPKKDHYLEVECQQVTIRLLPNFEEAILERLLKLLKRL